jgi:hypothetical protein
VRPTRDRQLSEPDTAELTIRTRTQRDCFLNCCAPGPARGRIRSKRLLQIAVGSIKLRRMDELTVWQELLIVDNGRAVGGWYAVQHGMVRVKAVRGEKAKRLDSDLHPIWLAGRLLSELATEGKA